MKKIILILVVFEVLSFNVIAQRFTKWRGENSSGI